MDGFPSLIRTSEWEIRGRRRPYSATTGAPPPPGPAAGGFSLYDHGRPHVHHDRHHRTPRARDTQTHWTQSHDSLHEMERMLNQYQEDLRRKDDEILRLTSIETPRLPTYASTRSDPLYRADYFPAENVADVGALQARIANLEAKLMEADCDRESKEVKIRELTALCDVGKDAEAHNNALRQKLSEYEAAYGNIEGAAGRSELTIVTLQQQARDAHQRIIDLESRQRVLAEERDAAVQKAAETEMKFSELMAQISRMLPVPADVSIAGPHSFEQTVNMVRELVHENSLLRGQMTAVKDQVKILENEQQSNRDLITKLTTEVNEHNRSASTGTIELTNLILERDNALGRQRELEREIDLLKERLEASQVGWSEARQELEHKAQEDSASQFSIFRQSLAHLLSDVGGIVEPSEQRIMDCVHDLLHIVHDKTTLITQLEQQVADLSLTRCDSPVRVSTDCQRPCMKPDLDHLENRLRRAEAELATLDEPKEHQHRAGRRTDRTDKEQLLRFVSDVSRMLHLDSAVVDVDNETIMSSILTRLGQLVRNESTSLADCRTHIRGLQNKLRTTKEQLDKREVEAELLCTKIAALEEKLSLFERRDHEKEEEFAKNRRLVQLVDKYKCELNEAHNEIQEFKTRLLEHTELHTVVSDKDQEISRLDSLLRQLEHQREHQEAKISDLEETVRTLTRQRDMHDIESVDRAAMLSDEVCSLRRALEETMRREHQLQDLRRVIARMLAIDAVSLSVPDYEIISRLDKLILANQTNSAIAIPLDDIVDELGDDFQAGYRRAGYILADRSRRRAGTSRPLNNRQRSPVRKIDGKVY